MKTFDAQWNEVADPDADAGRLEPQTRPVTHRWVVDVAEKSHEEVVAEYPNGGKDVAIVVDAEEEGHWETFLEDGTAVDFEDAIPGDAPHGQDVPGYQQYLLYTPYTDDELEEIARRKAEAEELRAKAEEREAYLEQAPQAQEDVMDALAEVGEVAADNATSSEEVMDALTELAAIVAGLSDAAGATETEATE